MLLYRIINFFELIQTLNTGNFRVPSAKGFSDQNELIGMLFSVLINPNFSPKTDTGIQDLLSSQISLRQSHYISCWTKTRDSIAMWEIYSPDHTSVQIEVDRDDLEDCFQTFTQNHSFAKAHHKPADHPEIFFYPPAIGECQYEDIQKVYDRLLIRTKELQEQANAALSEGDEKAFFEQYDAICREADKKGHDLSFLKDHAYTYENEIRFSIRAMRRNNRSYEECEKDFGFKLFDTHLRPATCEEAGENIFIEFPSCLIKHIYLDGRAPPWLIDTQKSLLHEYGIETTQSHTYSSFTDGNLIRKLWD